MDLTEGTIEQKTSRAKINMMWFAMISMVMTFAGLTSAYIVSKSRADWVSEFKFPTAFFYSLAVIILSSICFHLMKKAIIDNKRQIATIMLVSTCLSGILFVYLQLKGFGQIVDQGFFPTGSESTIVTSFIYAIVFVHLLHIAGGLIVLLVVAINHFRGKYTKSNHLGLKLAGMYWHFVDVLWVYLFCFLYFMR